MTHFAPLTDYPILTVVLPKRGFSIHRRFPFASAKFFSKSLLRLIRKNQFLMRANVNTENFRGKQLDALRLTARKKSKNIFFADKIFRAFFSKKFSRTKSRSSSRREF